MASAIARLAEHGQAPWYDNLTRDLLEDGTLARLIQDDHIRGVTSNPTIFEKAMAQGQAYDQQLRELAGRGSIEDAYWALVERDIEAAADLLLPVYKRLGGADGFVSVEVSPDLAHDTDGTIAAARDLHARIGRDNVMVKIPGTREGLPAIEETVAAGINVNVTLIFSLDRYAEVVDAFMRGLERRVAAGESVVRIGSVASFFVSRVDTETDRRLPDDSPLRGKLAVANAKLVYQRYLEFFCENARWDALVDKEARVQRPLWASTSTKNPAYSDTLYVDELVGRNTVNTLAQASIDALHDHGDPKSDTILAGIDEARQVFADLAAAGVVYDDVTATLEREGVESFARSYHDCLQTLEKRAAEFS
jgi:transaldolase